MTRQHLSGSAMLMRGGGPDLVEAMCGRRLSGGKWWRGWRKAVARSRACGYEREEGRRRETQVDPAFLVGPTPNNPN